MLWLIGVGRIRGRGLRGFEEGLLEEIRNMNDSVFFCIGWSDQERF